MRPRHGAPERGRKISLLRSGAVAAPMVSAGIVAGIRTRGGEQADLVGSGFAPPDVNGTF